MRESEIPPSRSDLTGNNCASKLDDFADTEDCSSGVVSVLKDVKDGAGQAIADVTDDAVFCGWADSDSGEENEITQITDMREIIGDQSREIMSDLFGAGGTKEVPADLRLDLLGEDD